MKVAKTKKSSKKVRCYVEKITLDFLNIHFFKVAKTLDLNMIESIYNVYGIIYHV